MRIRTTAGLRVACPFVLLVAFSLVVSVLAANCEAQIKGTFESGGGSATGFGDGTWKWTRYLSKVEGFAEPDQAAREFQLEYDPPTLDEFGNRATISGRMSYRKNDGFSPVNWLQGITVLLSIEPDASGRWTKNAVDNATLHDTAILKNDGSFSVGFDLRDTTRDPLVIEEFQIGVTLATTKVLLLGKQNVFWSSNDRLLGESVQEISIPVSPAISHELRLIDQACKWPFEDGDGAKLIRAVNALHAQGKGKAIASMRQYLEQSSDDFGESDEVVFWILRSLFEPVDLEERSFRPMIFVAFFVDSKTQRQLWPWDPMDVVDQIPFMLGQQIGGGGSPEHPISHLDWFEKHGVLRHQPLNPTVNPLVAAERLLTSKKFQTLKDSASETSFVRSQALAMVGATPDVDGYFETDDQTWAKHLESKLATKIWNIEKQHFELPTDQ